MSLPVHLTSRDSEQYPELVKLLNALSQHITENGTSCSVQKDLSQAEESLKREKQFYLQFHILHHELQEFIMDQEIAGHDVAPSSSAAQLHEAIKHCLYTAEAADYLHPNPTASDEAQPCTLLGLTTEQLQRANPHHKRLQSLQQQLIPQIEDRLRKKCEELVSFHQSQPDSETDQMAFAKATRLPDLLLSQSSQLEEEERKLKLDRAHRDKQFWQYYQALMDSLGVLEQLITKHRLRLQADSDTITSNWLSARCHAMCLKLRVFEARLLCDTYTPEVVTALKQIKHHLNRAIEERDKDVSRLSQALQAYQSIGMGFDQLVREYEQLQAAIDNKTWALTELKQSLVSDSAAEWKTD
ncbi:HAUS augmin-like complex subunit 4 isoform X2 [Patiria miniata]|nr:HAUS augmin-like complex subunit 4 isoform X2 [Patiria miniata]XP_038070092.1 HAUS augmin-like complex subunit 4 isoform X2 [Patiria miniata]